MVGSQLEPEAWRQDRSEHHGPDARSMLQPRKPTPSMRSGGSWWSSHVLASSSSCSSSLCSSSEARARSMLRRQTQVSWLDGTFSGPSPFSAKVVWGRSLSWKSTRSDGGGGLLGFLHTVSQSPSPVLV